MRRTILQGIIITTGSFLWFGSLLLIYVWKT